MKNLIPPLNIVFRYQKFPETPEEPLHELFRGDKNFRQFFAIQHFWFIKILSPDNRAIPKTYTNTEKGRRTIFLFLLDKKI